jgi:Flp pilus assembly protein TadD
MARELKSYPQATFNDQLLYIELLRQLGDSQFTKFLTDIEKEAASDPAKLAAMFSWMNANKMSLLAIDFARHVPNHVAAKWPVPLTLAESLSKLANWPELESRLRNQDWGDFDSARHAYLSLALKEAGKPVEADREWGIAQKQASAQPTLLSLLSRTIANWGWKKENVDLLWMLAKHPETQLEALQALYQNYSEQGDTLGLYRVLTRLAELLPEDPRIQNNLAQMRLLLNRDVDQAETLSAQLHSKDPSNPFYASTYAFALYSMGDTDGALEIMNGLHESELGNPALATYYGIVLAAAGEHEKAKKYLTIATSGQLLPEERALIAKAEASLK